ncbi:MAG: hypothetical protein NVV59_08245 [Chitinophagaceae bacterium]|nr:hypothetical protein [Chitinophagaceae bacterium]
MQFITDGVNKILQRPFAESVPEAFINDLNTQREVLYFLGMADGLVKEEI